MIVKTTADVMDLVKWTNRQNTNLQLYIEWWLTHPGDRGRAPYQILFDPIAGVGRVNRGTVTVGAFRLVGENDYLLDWIRSVADSERLGRYGLEGLQIEN